MPQSMKWKLWRLFFCLPGIYDSEESIACDEEDNSESDLYSDNVRSISEDEMV